MLGLLQTIAQGILDFGSFITAGCVAVINLFFDGITVAAEAAFLLLPSMPSVPTFQPELLAEANWWYPFGAVATGATTALALYVSWLVVRWLLRLVRAA